MKIGELSIRNNRVSCDYLHNGESSIRTERQALFPIPVCNSNRAYQHKQDNLHPVNLQKIYGNTIITLKIPEDKIGALIGPGGKNIKALCDESGCEINIEDDGTVRIYGTGEEGINIARTAVEALSAEIKVGEIYRGKVVSIKDFGCFVEVLPGKEGLVHISELANFRVKQVEDIVRIGDTFPVKCVGVDDKGRVRLSRKAALAERDREMKNQSEETSEK